MSGLLITGTTGQLGSHLAQIDPSAVALTRAELDVASAASIDAAIERYRPDVVINAAAYTAVDAAESDVSSAVAVNADGPGHLARALAASGGRLIHVSTDYVYPGTSDRPYETSDPTGPRTVYGQTKLAGEQAALQALGDRCAVVRTAWVYGGPSPNFVDTMLRLERERDSVDVVSDQTGSPTGVADLAGALLALAAAFTPGVLHYANTGTASWYELARETFRLSGADVERVRPVSSDAFPRPAPRPAWSVLSMTSWLSAGLPPPRSWQAALAEYIGTRAS